MMTRSPRTQPYFAFAESDCAHGHTVEASGFEAAAVGFAERYSPAGDAEDDAVRIFVRRLEDGVEHCFVIHLGLGAAERCAETPS